ncbi:hypothetical protein [Desulfonatronovibrio hydrogenovorans]|uniref:hypothetical protein n=1 Tax=Desulfonatronovibrio hydrogenovorans TaxID=53245 RepID=UPI00048F58D9|nr:hypothetical protein [Desulfonatronovibrio hydrogenovorans]
MAKTSALIFTLALCLVFVFGVNLNAGIQEEGDRILSQRCSVCHDLARVKNADKTRAEWENTVDRMISIGARVTPEEKPVLIDHLAQ